jgi:hypothetical protein
VYLVLAELQQEYHEHEQSVQHEESEHGYVSEVLQVLGDQLLFLSSDKQTFTCSMQHAARTRHWVASGLLQASLGFPELMCTL